MPTGRATAVAPANIAFVKYWGVQDSALTLPFNGSISMNVDACLTTTRVAFDPLLEDDEVVLELFGQEPRAATGIPRQRVVAHLDRMRALAGMRWKAHVRSHNNFPSDAGIASSAAAFAALSLAGATALGLPLDEQGLSLLARRSGSGSACRSIPSGYAEWVVPTGSFDRPRWDEGSFAYTIAPPAHWALADVVAVVDAGTKKVGSAENHRLAAASPYFAARLAELPARLDAVREAIMGRDLQRLGEAIEEDAISLHVICMTQRPPSIYWSPATLAVIHAVRAWRTEGLMAYFTIDAGPNVHVICHADDRATVAARLQQVPGVQFTLANLVGPGARVAD
jgi:diphosphomevalonate decarboxylase